MPNSQPNDSAGEPLPADTRDVETAAVQIEDDGTNDQPGGGGLFGGDARSGERLAGTGPAPGGTAPNAPIDVPVPADTLDDGADPSADADARVRSADMANDRADDAA